MPDLPHLVAALKRGLDITPEQAATIATRIVPTVPAASVSSWWENDTFATRPGAAFASIAGTAGNVSWCSLSNPLKSGVNVVTELVMLYIGATTSLRVAWNEAHTNGTAFQRAWRDARDLTAATPIPQQPVAVLYGSSGVGTLPTTLTDFVGIRINPALDYMVPMPLKCLIPPGWALTLRTTGLNIALDATWYWEELRQSR